MKLKKKENHVVAFIFTDFVFYKEPTFVFYFPPMELKKSLIKFLHFWDNFKYSLIIKLYR